MIDSMVAAGHFSKEDALKAKRQLKALSDRDLDRLTKKAMSKVKDGSIDNLLPEKAKEQVYQKAHESRLQDIQRDIQQKMGSMQKELIKTRAPATSSKSSEKPSKPFDINQFKK